MLTTIVVATTAVRWCPAAATGAAGAAVRAIGLDRRPTTPFLPDDTTTNITDCVSALPRPECGSRERGGWRQGVVFGVVVAGLVAIGARLVIGIRRRDGGGHTAADDT